jgi:hypothetical protein
MFFSHWFRRSHRSSSTYRPEVCLLEERAVPTLLRPPAVSAAPVATHFAVIIPQNVAAGTAVNVIVEAETAANKIVTNFKGTVAVGLGTADAGAVIPATFTFSAADHGVHTFKATLAATGPQTLTATSGTRTGSASFTVNAPVTHFSVTIMGKPTAGTAALVNVVALDANNNAVPGYTGTIHFTASGFVSYPLVNYTFTAADNGSHLFDVTFTDAGSQALAVNDVANGSIAGSAQVKVLAGWNSGYSAYPNYGYPSYGYPSYGYASYGYGSNYYGYQGYYGLPSYAGYYY